MRVTGLNIGAQDRQNTHKMSSAIQAKPESPRFLSPETAGDILLPVSIFSGLLQTLLGNNALAIG
jgi:hypothetical protein